MEWVVGIQRAIDYIEDHITEELDYEGDAIPQPRDLPPFDMGEEDF